MSCWILSFEHRGTVTGRHSNQRSFLIRCETMTSLSLNALVWPNRNNDVRRFCATIDSPRRHRAAIRAKMCFHANFIANIWCNPRRRRRRMNANVGVGTHAQLLSPSIEPIIKRHNRNVLILTSLSAVATATQPFKCTRMVCALAAATIAEYFQNKNNETKKETEISIFGQSSDRRTREARIRIHQLVFIAIPFRICRIKR